jgi:uncharacterized protein YegL
MKKDLAEIIFIVDRSGSMQSIRKDMIGGFNSFIAEQKKLTTDCKVTLYQFDSSHGEVLELVYEKKDLKDVPDLTELTFVPRGGTPLYEAVAKAVKAVGERLSSTPEDERPEKVLVVIITDGGENSSQDWTSEQVNQMIEHQEQIYKWEFVYLGANQDAWLVGGAIGVKASSTLGYVASAGGTDSMWKSLSDKTIKYRSAAPDVDQAFAFDDADKKSQVDQGYSP